MTTTKRTAELVKGDVIIDASGNVLMTVRKVAEAVERGYSVVWFFGPRGGAHRIGYQMAAEWTVRQDPGR